MHRQVEHALKVGFPSIETSIGFLRASSHSQIGIYEILLHVVTIVNKNCDRQDI